MRRRARAGIVTLALALTALSSCGASGTTTAERDAAPGAGPETAPTAKPGGGGGVALKQIGSFDSPVYVAGAPGQPRLLFVVEQGGKVQVMRNGRRLGRPFLDISGLVSFEGERGLLSVAFPPDYGDSGLFYVYYTDNRGDIRIDEFRRGSRTRAAAGSRRPVIQVPHRENSNHNGGQAQFFGDLLYFGTGDGGSGGDPPNNAQNRESLLGKLLRIDPRASGGRPYRVPSSNPFVGRPGRDEIYSYGLRNPFRFSFDTVTAKAPRIVIGDVGQSRFEEVDYTTVAVASGANFGWDAFEGFAPYGDSSGTTPDPGGTVKPIFAYSHGRGGCSLTGGYVVADRGLPSLFKRYVYTDYCDGSLRSLVPHLGRASGDRKLGLSVEEPGSFGTDTRGRVYVTSLAGPVYRLVSR
jgi:glucose/arabinose dehydrogenase